MIKVGQKFKEKRLEKGLTIEEISDLTKIKSVFLTAIEDGEYKKLPSQAYAQGFVKNYAKFLEMPEKETLAIFKREFDEEQIYKVLPSNFSEKKNFSLVSLRKKQTGIFIFFILLSLILYIFIQYRSFFFNPYLEVSKPLNNFKSNSSEVEVMGKTDLDNVVFVNEYPVNVDSNGNFRKVISLFPGKNQIEIKSVNKFNKETLTTREIDVLPNP